jgi:hypothetical protein
MPKRVSTERAEGGARSERPATGTGSPERPPNGATPGVFPGWTLAVGNGYIFPDNPGKVRSLGGLPPFFVRPPCPARRPTAAGSRASGGFTRWLQFKSA